MENAIFRLNKNIDDKSLYHKLKTKIYEYGLGNPDLIDFNSVQDDKLYQLAFVNKEVSVKSHSSFRSFIKKIVRKLSRFIVHKVVDEQNSFNFVAFQRIIELENKVDTLQKQLNDLRKQVNKKL